jgi:hypothetical protein
MIKILDTPLNSIGVVLFLFIFENKLKINLNEKSRGNH